jgi:hypothetical protein
MHHGCMKQRIWVRSYPCQRPGVGVGVVGYCRKQAGRRPSAECLVASATAAEDRKCAWGYTHHSTSPVTTEEPLPPTNRQAAASQASAQQPPQPTAGSKLSNKQHTAAYTTNSQQPSASQRIPYGPQHRTSSNRTDYPAQPTTNTPATTQQPGLATQHLALAAGTLAHPELEHAPRVIRNWAAECTTGAGSSGYGLAHIRANVQGSVCEGGCATAVFQVQEGGLSSIPWLRYRKPMPQHAISDYPAASIPLPAAAAAQPYKQQPTPPRASSQQQNNQQHSSLYHRHPATSSRPTGLPSQTDYHHTSDNPTHNRRPCSCTRRSGAYTRA